MERWVAVTASLGDPVDEGLTGQLGLVPPGR